MNKWDDELTDIMRHSENNCHKFKQNHIEWSPEVGLWICRRRLLNECLRYKLGRGKRSSNMFRRCKASEIADPRRMTLDDLRVEMFICGKKIEELKTQAPHLRHKHLNTRLSYQLTKLSSVMSAAEFQLKLNKWDDELTDFMIHSENNCHRFKQNHIEWSPEVGVWIRRRILLSECLRYKLSNS